MCPICRSDIDYRFSKTNQNIFNKIMEKYGEFIQLNKSNLIMIIECKCILLKYSFIEFKIGNTINSISVILPLKLISLNCLVTSNINNFSFYSHILKCGNN